MRHADMSSAPFEEPAMEQAPSRLAEVPSPGPRGPGSGPMLVVEGGGPAASDPDGNALRVPFEGLDRALLDRVRPSLVVCPLFTPRFDAIQVMERLDTLGWRGRLCALSRPLPDPAMVCAEVQAAAPEIAFDLVQVP